MKPSPEEIADLQLKLDALIPMADLLDLAGGLQNAFRAKGLNAVCDQGILSEIRVNVLRSLGKKLPHCCSGYNAHRVAGYFCFWVHKLKPLARVNSKTSPYINEFFALALGSAIVKIRAGVTIRLHQGELNECVLALRLHTSSPHAMTRLFAAWISRSRGIAGKIPSP